MQRKIRIAYIIDELNIGGTEKQLVSTIELINKDQFEVLLVCLRSSEYFSQIDLQCKKMILNLSSLISIKGLSRFFSLLVYLRKHRIDIVQTFFFDANIFGVLAAKLAGVPRIISCRRDMGFWYTPRLLFFLKGVNKLVCRFLVNSYAIKENIIKYEFIPEHKIDVIHNGIYLEPFQKKFDTDIIKEKIGLSQSESVVGIVANLNRKVKRVDLFLEAAQQVLKKNKSVSFVIIGDGCLRSGLEELSRRLGLQDKIFFIGQKEDVCPYLSVFDIGVICSDSEGFSNSILEYAAAGIPVVATDTGGTRELLKKQNLGCLVPVGDYQGIADAILEFLRDKPRMARISINARNIVRQEYSWEAKIKEIEKYYCQILEYNKHRPLTPGMGL